MKKITENIGILACKACAILASLGFVIVVIGFIYMVLSILTIVR